MRARLAVFRYPGALIAVLALAACSESSSERLSLNPGHGDYRAPGSASDPWGPFIRSASDKFSVPDSWIRAVMQQESGGHQYMNGHLTTSGSGAMGLMQLMADTYSDMRYQYGLGDDPYDPHDNIFAGTAYIRQMYDRFGSPGFLAAYNAGPARVEKYVADGTPLPDETINYVASIKPNLSGTPTMMAAAKPARRLTPAAAPTMVAMAAPPAGPLSRTADGCLRNADAAYDDRAPCLVDQDTPHPDPEPQEEAPPPVALAAATSQDRLPVELANYVEPRTSRTSLPTPPTTTFTPSAAIPGWAIQVGAFSSDTEAREALSHVRSMIGGARLSAVVSPVSSGSRPLYRARLVGFEPGSAANACQTLKSHAMACFTVPART